MTLQKGIEPFNAFRFLSLEKPSFYDGISANPIVTATSSYATDGSKVVTLTSNTNFKNGSSSGGGYIFDAGDRVFADDGSYIGTVNAKTGSSITFVDEPNLVDGLRYCSANTGQDGIFYKMKYTGASWGGGVNQQVYGRGGKR